MMIIFTVLKLLERKQHFGQVKSPTNQDEKQRSSLSSG